MIRRQLMIFVVRWMANTGVLSILVLWPQSGIHLAPGLVTVLIAGLTFTLLNAWLKPLIVLTALPFLFITIGVFTLLVNALIFFITTRVYSGLMIEGWIWLLIASISLSLVNAGITIVTHRTQQANT